MKSKLLLVDNEIECLIQDIYKEIYKMSKSELNRVRYGVVSKIDYSRYEDLVDYLEILKNKVYGCNCLEGTPYELLVMHIKKLIKRKC